MPFQSEKQRRYLWANEPQIARDWTDTYGSRIHRDNGGITNPRLLPHQPRDLLVQNNPYGTRPRYQPPGHRDAPVGGPPGGGATSQGSGRDAPGSDRGPRDAPDRHGPVQTVTQFTGGDRIIDVAQRKKRQDIREDIARREAEKEYTRKGVRKTGPQLGWAGSGVGGGLGNWASGFAGSKIGGGLGSMLFGPWGALLGALFGRGVGTRAWQARQTDEKETLRDIMLGQNTLLSNVFNKKPTGEGLGGIDLSDMRDKIYQKDPGAVGIENKFADNNINNLYADLSKVQQGILDRSDVKFSYGEDPKATIERLLNQGSGFTGHNIEEAPATEEDIENWYKGTYQPTMIG